jgi:hypothetical protein
VKPKLEDLIRDAAERGKLTHLSGIGSWNKSNNGVTYKAFYRSNSVCFGEAADPVDALIDALTDPAA